MNWQFWKKQSSISNKSKAYTVPFSLEKFDNSVSSWKEELSYLDTQYRVVLKDTTTKLLSNYNVLFTTFSIRVDSSIKEKIQQIEAEVEQGLIIMKNEILKNLNETLDNLHKECEEEGFESFSEIAEENAQKILNAVYKKFPNYEYYIYP
ncbi:MAG: hypothetical protein F4X95_02030, partial [Oligoflexia bacterium]|nr:hypothetical protein [Oligoflexia bacterium]